MTEPSPGAADTALPVSTSAVDERPISLRAYPCRSRPAATANATTMTRTQWAAGVHLARRCWSASFSVELLMWDCSCGTAHVGLGVGLPLTLCGEPWPLLVDEWGDGLCVGRAVPAGEGLPCGVCV